MPGKKPKYYGNNPRLRHPVDRMSNAGFKSVLGRFPPEIIIVMKKIAMKNRRSMNTEMIFAMEEYIEKNVA